MIPTLIPKALALGFSTGVFCLGFCYPILAPLMLSRQDASLRGTALSAALFLAGRLAAYIIFGVISGLLGRFVTGSPVFQKAVVPALFFALGVLLALYGVFPRLPKWRICRLAGKFLETPRFLFWAGLLAGLNLCPPFLLGLSYALSLGSVGGSVLFFVFFYIATSVFLLPFFFSGFLARFALVRRAARITAVAAGLWFVYLAVRAMA